MEDLLKEATKTIEEVQEAAPIIAPEPPNNTVRNVGIGVLIVVLAVLAKKGYCCTKRTDNKE